MTEQPDSSGRVGSGNRRLDATIAVAISTRGPPCADARAEFQSSLFAARISRQSGYAS